MAPYGAVAGFLFVSWSPGEHLVQSSSPHNPFKMLQIWRSQRRPFTPIRPPHAGNPIEVEHRALQTSTFKINHPIILKAFNLLKPRAPKIKFYPSIPLSFQPIISSSSCPPTIPLNTHTPLLVAQLQTNKVPRLACPFVWIYISYFPLCLVECDRPVVSRAMAQPKKRIIIFLKNNNSMHRSVP